MKRCTHTRRLYNNLLLSAIFLVVSCSMDDELMTCPYNVQLEYWYSQEGTKDQNMMNNYIYDVVEYIFDEDELLYSIQKLPGNSVRGKYFSEMTLPPGRYTVVAWGNLPNTDPIFHPTIGETTLDMMVIRLGMIDRAISNNNDDPDRIWGNIGRIYYAYSTFTVQEKSISRIRIGMTHAHCVLDVTVKWKVNAPPNTKNFRLQLRDVPGVYMGSPSYGSGIDGPVKIPVTDYPVNNRNAIYYIPTVQDGKKLQRHQAEAKMDITRTLKGELITHRYCNNSHILFSVYAGDEQITKEIDLQKYFQAMNIDRDQNLRQEFHIVVEVQKDQIVVYPAILSDWENGGIIGGDL